LIACFPLERIGVIKSLNTKENESDDIVVY